MLTDEKLTMTLQCALEPRNHPRPGLHQKERGQQVKEGDSPPILCFHESLSGVLHSTPRPPTQEGCGAVRASQEDAMEML